MSACLFALKTPPSLPVSKYLYTFNRLSTPTQNTEIFPEKIKSKSKSQFRLSASDKVDLFRFQTKKNNLKRIPYVTSLDPLFELK